MKNCIYVFTGTGTSLSIAKNIGNHLGNTEIKLIPYILANTVTNEIVADAETIGFVFPNYFGGIPAMVTEFVKKMNIDKSNYIFSIVTAGGGQGYSLKFLERELAEKGKKLNYGKYVAGISNYIVAWYYNLFTKTGEKRKKVLQKLDEVIANISEDINCKKDKVEKSNFFVFKVNRFLSEKKIIEDTRLGDKEFIVTDECIGCKTCEKICQVKNIIIKDKKPIFQHNCQRCMACIHYCPNNAIGFKGKSLNKPRYYHPDYPAEKLINIINGLE